VGDIEDGGSVIPGIYSGLLLLVGSLPLGGVGLVSGFFGSFLVDLGC
jgi:hypothetical protein